MPLELHEFGAQRITRQSAHEGDIGVSHTYWPSSAAGDIPGIHFLLENESTPGS